MWDYHHRLISQASFVSIPNRRLREMMSSWSSSIPCGRGALNCKANLKYFLRTWTCGRPCRQRSSSSHTQGILKWVFSCSTPHSASPFTSSSSLPPLCHNDALLCVIFVVGGRQHTDLLHFLSSMFSFLVLYISLGKPPTASTSAKQPTNLTVRPTTHYPFTFNIVGGQGWDGRRGQYKIMQLLRVGGCWPADAQLLHYKRAHVKAYSSE